MDRLYRDVGKVLNRWESSNDRRVFGPKAHSSVPKLGGYGGMPPREILKMHTLGDAFSWFWEQNQGHSGQTFIR